MVLKDFKKIKLADVELTQLQNNIHNYLSQLTNNTLLSGNLIASVDIINGDTNIAHGLNRTPQGYLVVSRSANVVVWDEAAKQTTPKTFLTLSANANATIGIYIF